MSRVQAVESVLAAGFIKMRRPSGIPFFDRLPPRERVDAEWIGAGTLGLRWVGKVDAPLMRVGLEKMTSAVMQSPRTLQVLLCDTSEVTGFSNISAEARQIL